MAVVEAVEAVTAAAAATVAYEPIGEAVVEEVRNGFGFRRMMQNEAVGVEWTEVERSV